MAIRFGYKTARNCGNCMNMVNMCVEKEIFGFLAQDEEEEYEVYEACMIDDDFVPVDSDHVCMLHDPKDAQEEAIERAHMTAESLGAHDDDADGISCATPAEGEACCGDCATETTQEAVEEELSTKTIIEAMLPRQQMSGGLDPTLENYLTRAELFFGPNSKPVSWLKQEINCHGKNALVESSEMNMVSIMFDLHHKGETNGTCKICPN